MRGFPFQRASPEHHETSDAPSPEASHTRPNPASDPTEGKALHRCRGAERVGASGLRASRADVGEHVCLVGDEPRILAS